MMSMLTKSNPSPPVMRHTVRIKLELPNLVKVFANVCGAYRITSVNCVNLVVVFKKIVPRLGRQNIGGTRAVKDN